MPVCDTGGNDQDKAFQVIKSGQTHNLDSFECTIQKLAPVCERCEVQSARCGSSVMASKRWPTLL